MGNLMTCKINADTTDGLKLISDTSGAVDIQSNGTTKVTIDANGNINTVGQVSTTDNGTIVTRPNVKPLIINGDMAVAQRGTSTTGITGGGYHTIDRMKVDLSDNGTWTHTQDTDVPTGEGFANSWKLDCTTADTSVASGTFHLARYLFEGQDLQLLKKGTSNAEKVTISFWIKATVTGTYIAELFDTDNSRQISQSYTVSSSNTWEKKVLSFAGDTSGTLNNDNGSSFAINLWLGAGSDFSGGTLNTSWASSTNANRAVGQVNSGSSTSNNVYFTGLQMEVGEYDSTTIPAFQHESYSDNLQRCKRYCQSTFSQGTAIGSATAVGIIVTCATGTGIGRTSTGHQFPVSFRAPPTIVIHNQTGGTTGSGRNGDTGGLIAMSAGLASTDSAHFENSAAMGNDGAQLQFQFSATSEL